MSSISSKWTPKQRDYVSEHKQFNKPTTVTTNHPLGIIVVRSRNFSIEMSFHQRFLLQASKPQTVTSTSSPIIDPLSAKISQVDIDPLSRALSAAISTNKKELSDGVGATTPDTFEPWSSKKSLILNQYSTTKKISMTTATNNSNDESTIDNSKGRTVYIVLERLFVCLFSFGYDHNIGKN